MVENMKILYITDNLDPHTGWGRYSRGVIDEMKRRGLRLAELTAEQLPKPRSFFDFMRNCLRARRAARGYEIVHALDTWPFGLYALGAVLGTNKKLFINAVGTYSVAPLSNLVKRFIVACVYARASKVFAISNYVAKLVREKIKTNKIITVYLGLSPLPVPSEQDLTWAKNLIAGRSPVLLTVGAVEARKGQKDVAEAVSSLKKDYPNMLYIMTGVNRDIAYLESIEHGRNVIYVPDAGTDARLATLYSLANVFLLVSRRLGDHVEGFGLVALEAASFGLPAVGSCDSGVAEAMSDGYNGYAVPSGEPGEIAQAVNKILSGDYEKLHANSKEWASRFSWEKTVGAYINEYDK